MKPITYELVHPDGTPVEEMPLPDTDIDFLAGVFVGVMKASPMRRPADDEPDDNSRVR